MTLANLDNLRQHVDTFNWINPEMLKGYINLIQAEVDKYYLQCPLLENGEPIEIGETYQATGDGQQWTVLGFRDGTYNVIALNNKGTRRELKAGWLRKITEVPDADGVPIKVGDTVWEVSTGLRFDVTKVTKNHCVHTVQGQTFVFPEETLTHKEPLSIEKLVDDMRSLADRMVAVIASIGA